MALLWLPVELLDQIVGYLEPADVARLMACNSRQLVPHYERRLYTQQKARDSAMLAACRLGLIRIIRRLVLDYGAPASIVQTGPFPTAGSGSARYIASRNIPKKQLSLFVTAANGHFDACRELARLGARMDVASIGLGGGGGQGDLLHLVFSPRDDWALLHLFYEEELDDHVFPEYRIFIAEPLLRVIDAHGQRGRPPLRTVQMLLDRGAAGSSLDGDFQSRNALTVAMRQQEYDPIPVLDLLLGAGAAINGPQAEGGVLPAALTPIFAAVEAMATRGDTSLVDWCSQRGADIDRCAVVQDSRTESTYQVTPALFYVICVDFWAGRPWDPTEGLKFLLDRGAHMELDPEEAKRPTTSGAPWPFAGVGAGSGSLWCLEYLLAKWGMADMLNTPSYRRMIGYLIQLNVQREDTMASETLSRCEHGLKGNPELDPLHDNSAQYSSAREATVCAWGVLVMNIILPIYKITPTQLLAQYIVYKGSHFEPVEHLARATIQVLLDAGADINARIADADDGSTLLHRLCREVGRAWMDAPKGCGSFCTFQAHVRTFSLFTHVLNKGANRAIRTHDGRRAKDVLLEGLDPKRCERLERVASMLG
ncbi:hypothetical protein BJY01DRAFT_256184 [Aspergillus pseudoustus]|uniref:F-box domain-containing protein n=1 Tax=Aspergillus pseudoustus TaxID=1810923 RepID=A0ABR4IEL0_9EURO